MINSRFSSLVYRIIGKPEIVHDEYTPIMNRALEELELFTDPSHMAELEVGNQILGRIENSDSAVSALSALLDNSRFKIIILNSELRPIYHNKNAEKLLNRISNKNNKQQLNENLSSAIGVSLKKQAHSAPKNSNDSLIELDFLDKSDQKFYLKTIVNKTSNNQSSQFQLLLVLDQNQRNPLNHQLVNEYQFTQKEQQVLIELIHGSTIKEIAKNEYISENTVKTHLKSIYRKTNTKSQTQIVSLILSHESQVVGSYFSHESNFSNNELKSDKDRVITLKNNHKITYREYGQTNGRALIVFHNSYGSRLMIPRNYRAICKKTNRRVIIIDRPGYGESGYIKGHPEKWHEHLNEIISKLGINEYEILAAVLGCPLALHFASKADNKLKRLILSSPFLINTEEDTKHLLGILAPAQMLVKGSVTFARQVYELWLKSVKLNLNTHYRNMIESGVGSAEKEVFQNDGTVDLIVNTFREASKNTLNGLSHEMAFCLTPRQIDLSQIKIPVDLWWGTEDLRFTREGVENIAKKLPNSNLYIKEGYSEHLYYALFEEMINTPIQ